MSATLVISLVLYWSNAVTIDPLNLDSVLAQLDTRNGVTKVTNADDAWKIVYENGETVNYWPLRIRLNSPTYAFQTNGISELTVSIHVEPVTDELDLFYVFEVGDEYVSMVNDFDGSLGRVGNGNSGFYHYPDGGQPLATGGANNLLDDVEDPSKSGGMNVKKATAGGDKDNWVSLENGAYNGNTSPVTFIFTNNRIDDTLTVTFQGRSFQLSQAFDADKNFNIWFCPDTSMSLYDETAKIGPLEVSIVHYTPKPTLQPTASPSRTSTASPSRTPTTSPTGSPVEPTQDITAAPSQTTDNPSTIPTMTSNDIILTSHDGLSRWWIGFMMRNEDLSCGGTITLVEITDHTYYNGSWVPFLTEPWLLYEQCHFEKMDNKPYTAPLSVRITKTYNGDTEVVIGVDVLTDISNGGEDFDFGTNFYSCTAHPTVLETDDPTMDPTIQPSQATILSEHDDVNVELNISFTVRVANVTTERIENITVALIDEKYDDFSYKLIAIADDSVQLDVSFITANRSTANIVRYFNETLIDDIKNDLRRDGIEPEVEVVIVYVTIEPEPTANELSFAAITRMFQYTNIGLVLLFLFIAITGFIDAKVFRVNDVFKIGKILQPLVHGLDTMADVFLCLEVSMVYQLTVDYNDKMIYLILLACMAMFILIPISFSIAQLVHISNKHWLNDKGIDNSQVIKVWLEQYVYVLYISSVITGSSFSATSLFNSNLFGLRIFDMGLSESALSHFRTKRIYSIVFCENVPQLILQFIYWHWRSDSVIALVSMGYSAISILITMIAIYTQRRIIYGQDTVVITFEVCGPSVVQNADILRNRMVKIGVQVSPILGVEKTLIEVLRPRIIRNGLEMRLNIKVDQKHLYQFEEIMSENKNNGLLVSALKKGWNVKQVQADMKIQIHNIVVVSKAAKRTSKHTATHIQMASESASQLKGEAKQLKNRNQGKANNKGKHDADINMEGVVDIPLMNDATESSNDTD
eukprot:560792_1